MQLARHTIFQYLLYEKEFKITGTELSGERWKERGASFANRTNALVSHFYEIRSRRGRENNVVCCLLLSLGGGCESYYGINKHIRLRLVQLEIMITL